MQLLNAIGERRRPGLQNVGLKIRKAENAVGLQI
jgi:hypothetical protein